MKRPVVVVFSVVGAWTAGCSSNGNATGTVNHAHTVADFAAQYCKIVEPCCADAGLSTSGNQCFDQMSGGGELAPYNPEAGQECLDAMLAASKKSDFCADFASNLPQCLFVFGGVGAGGGGLSAPGGPCTSNGDCAPAGGSSLCFMQPGGGSTTSTCVQTQPGAVGQEPCVATIRGGVPSYPWSGRAPSTGYTCDIADGVSCNPTTHACTALAATGQPCHADQDCVTSAYCTSGFCQPRAAVGAACGNTSGPECVSTAYCDSSSSICKLLLPSGSVNTGNSQLALACGK